MEVSNTKPEVSVVIPTVHIDPEMQLIDLKAALPDIDYEVIAVFNETRPRGFTATVNQGVRAARADNIIVMNSDVRPLNLVPLYKVLCTTPSLITFPRNVEGFMRYDLTGWCFAFKRELLDIVPGSPLLNEKFIHWYSDNFLVLSLKRLKQPLPEYVPTAKVIHHGFVLSRGLGSESYKHKEEVDKWIKHDTKVWEEWLALNEG